MNNQNKTNENQASLISRLMAKFHNPKIVKTLAGLILCGTIALSAVSCSNQGNKDPNDTSTNLPGTGLEDQYDENKKDESSNDETSQYSQMLLNVLNNDHYNSLIAQAKNNSFYLFFRAFLGILKV